MADKRKTDTLPRDVQRIIKDARNVGLPPALKITTKPLTLSEMIRSFSTEELLQLRSALTDELAERNVTDAPERDLLSKLQEWRLRNKL